MKTFLQTLFFFLLVTQICFAQWVQTNGHFGCDVLSLVVSGTDVFAGTMNGIYRSTDDGASWTAVDSGLANLEIHSLAGNGTDLFAGTFSSGVFHSPNNGSSWTAINNGLPTGFSGDALAVSGMNLFAGTRSSSGQGIYHSTNNGETWIQTAVNW